MSQQLTSINSLQDLVAKSSPDGLHVTIAEDSISTEVAGAQVRITGCADLCSDVHQNISSSHLIHRARLLIRKLSDGTFEINITVSCHGRVFNVGQATVNHSNIIITQQKAA